MENKKKLLTVLLFVLAVVVAYRLMNPFRQERVAQLTYTGKKVGDKHKESKESPPSSPGAKIRDSGFILNLLENPPRHSGRVRNPAFWGRDDKPARVQAPPPKTASAPVAKTPSAPPPPDPVLQVKQELSQFRIFGSFRSRGELALFMERGREILVVRKGDRIDGKYRVEEITPHTLTIRAENIDEAIYIDLGEL